MEISDLSNAERETLISMTADNRGMWTVYSDDPVMIRKFERVAEGTPHGVGMRFELDSGNISIRRKPQISREQREKLRKRAITNFSHDAAGATDAQNGR